MSNLKINKLAETGTADNTSGDLLMKTGTADTSDKLAEVDTPGKLAEVDTLKYFCNVISAVTKESYAIIDFVKRWYDNHLNKEYSTPEEAFYEYFCDKTGSGYAMRIPDLPILSTKHKNEFKKESDERIPLNWNCNNCTNCKWCVNCNNCKDCESCVDCASNTNCIDCKKCTYVDYAYNCRYVYHSCFVINKTNRVNLEGKCDNACNWNCTNCTDCICCVDCENCNNCYFSKDCSECTNLNGVYKEQATGIHTDSVIKTTQRMLRTYVLLDRLGMLCKNCRECADCDFVHDCTTESDTIGDIDPVNEEYINKYFDKVK